MAIHLYINNWFCAKKLGGKGNQYLVLEMNIKDENALRKIMSNLTFRYQLEKRLHTMTRYIHCALATN